ncbi:MAG: SpoIIE family protein phosphatase [Thermoplasmata archaeon]|nr:MAG: SpoIIE family protein phosphatase [Thermoplasmata archaeon]
MAAGKSKHFTIRSKILVSFLILSLIALPIFGFIALWNINEMGDYSSDRNKDLGEQAVDDSTTALEQQAEKHLMDMAAAQAEVSNTLFEKVEAEANIMSDFAYNLMYNSSMTSYRYSYSQNETPDDIYSTSVYVLASDVDNDSIQSELNLSSNMDEIFIPVYSSDPHLTWVYIGTKSGMIRIYPWCTGIPETYDPREREWYKNAESSEGISWSEPYIDVAGTGLMVTCSQRVNSPQDDMFWVIGLDVTIETINSDIINTKVGELGYALLIDQSGSVIARPGLAAGDNRWDESFETENLLESNNTELKAIAEKMTLGGSGVARCSFEDGEKYIAYAPINSTGWSVGFVMPVSEIIAPATETKGQIDRATKDTEESIEDKILNLQNMFIIIFIVIIIAVIALAYVLSGKITKPIKTLTKGANTIGQGHLEHRVDVKTGDELEDLADSFNKMALDLNRHMDQLQHTTAEKERLMKEMDIAQKIQQSILPEHVPDIEGIELAAFNQSAKEIGGDFYDFIHISEDKWGLAIADVSGKGMPAALFMALSRTLVRANTVQDPTAARAITSANKLICEDSKASMFVTLFYAIFDSKKRILTYVNAGHNPPLVLRKDTSEIVLLKAKGIALGVVESIELEEVEVELSSGDIVVLFTDGVTEALNDKGAQYGEKRLKDLLASNRKLTPQKIVDKIKADVKEFTRGEPQADDITMIILKVK